MIKDKKIFRNFIWNTMGSMLASFNSLFFLIAVTRINGLENAGIFSICVTTAMLLYIFAIYSGRNCHITDIENNIKDKDYIFGRIFTCIGMLIITVFYILVIKYEFYQAQILFFLCLWKALEAFIDVFYAILQKNGKLYVVGQALVLKSILAIVLFVLVDYFTHNLVLACSMLVLVSILVFILFELPKAKNLISKEEKASKINIIKIYKNEFFLFASAFLTMYLLNAPKYAIETYLNNEIQGIFGIILMPASILPLFAQFMTAPMMNELTENYRKKEYLNMKKIQNKLIFSILGFGVVAIIIAYILGIPVLNFIYQVNLENYELQLIGILFAYVIYAAGFIKTIILTIYRKIKEQFAVYFVSCIFMYIFSNMLVKDYGEQGIVPIYLIVMSIYYILFSVLTKCQYNKKLEGEMDENK